eukprot:463613-Rhodomonas_salina.3
MSAALWGALPLTMPHSTLHKTHNQSDSPQSTPALPLINRCSTSRLRSAAMAALLPCLRARLRAARARCVVMERGAGCGRVLWRGAG